MDIETEAAERLESLADQVRRLAPNRHDPERYFEEKSEIEAALRRLSKEART